MSAAATKTKRQTIAVAASAAQTVVMIGAVQSAFFGMRWYQRWWWVLTGRLPKLPVARADDFDRKVA